VAERLTSICADCGKVLYQGRLSLTNSGISHGGCKACLSKALWLDGFSIFKLTQFNNKMGANHA
jgi:hypothetical protein